MQSLRTFLVIGLVSTLAIANQVKEVAPLKQAPVSILSVTSIDVTEEHVDERFPTRSYVVLEIKGKYEGNGEFQNLAASVEGSAYGSFRSEHAVDLFSYSTPGAELIIGTGFQPQPSIVTPFKVTLRVKADSWKSRGDSDFYFSGEQLARDWLIKLPIRRFAPMRTEFVGVNLTLHHNDARKEWEVRPFGLGAN